LLVRTPEGYWGKPWTPEELAYLRENYTIMPAKEIAAHLGRSLNSVYQRASLEGLKSRHRTGVNSLRKDYFRVIDTPTKAYILGLLAADGSISKAGQLKLELHRKDVEIIQVVRDELAPDARLADYMSRTSPMTRFLVTHPQLTKDLASHGVVNAKSLITRYPLELPSHLDNSYICGYFDGDGSLGLKPMLRWTIVSGNPAFLKKIQERVQAHLGITIGGPYRDKRHDSAYSIILTGKLVRVLDEWIHRDVPGLARKRLNQE
jgi:hypothetical protein